MTTRACQWTILVGFLVVTAAAFVYTMTRVSLLPWRMIALSYGMMAPYQSTTPYNFAMAAEAVLEDGSRRPLDLKRYYPMGDPEMFIRQYVPFTHWRNDPTAPAVLASQYANIAAQILGFERTDSPEVRSIELFWEQWPLSIFGFETERLPGSIDRTFLARAV